MHAAPLIPNLVRVQTHAEDDGSTWPRGLQAPQPETGSRLLNRIFGLAVKCATPISWSALLGHTGFLLLAVWVSSFATALHSAHLGRWRRRCYWQCNWIEKIICFGDRKKGIERKGEGGGEVFTSNDLGFLDEVCVVRGQGQTTMDTMCGVFMWYGTVRIAWAFSHPGKATQKQAGLRVFAYARSAVVSPYLAGIFLKACSGFLIDFITTCVSSSLCLSWPKAQVLTEFLYDLLSLSFYNAYCAPMSVSRDTALLRLLITPLF